MATAPRDLSSSHVTLIFSFRRILIFLALRSHSLQLTRRADKKKWNAETEESSPTKLPGETRRYTTRHAPRPSAPNETPTTRPRRPRTKVARAARAPGTARHGVAWRNTRRAGHPVTVSNFSPFSFPSPRRNGSGPRAPACPPAGGRLRVYLPARGTSPRRARPIDPSP